MKKSRVLGLAAIFIVCIVCAFIFANLAIKIMGNRKIEKCKSEMRGIQSSLELHYTHHKYYPLDLQSLVTERYLLSIGLQDPWKNKYAYTAISGPLKQINNYYLGSYGPDGKECTDDDIEPPINPKRHSFVYDRQNQQRLSAKVILETKNNGNTVVVPYLDEEIMPGKNLLFCNTFQLAWNEAGKTFRADGNLKIVKILNKKLVTKDDLSPDCYLAGFGSYDKMEQELNNRVKDKKWTDVPVLEKKDFQSSDSIAYAYLFKTLEFAKEFHYIFDGMSFKGKKVLAFGIRGYLQELHGEWGKQVEIFDYKGPDDFIVLLKSKSVNDDIVLVKTPPSGTLLNMVNMAEKRIKSSKTEILKHADNLYIPEINVDIKHDYNELIGNGSNINKAFQQTRFCLNKKGAKVTSAAGIGDEVDGGYERNFIFDKPFLIYLKEKKGKYPSLVIWIDNPELLVE